MAFGVDAISANGVDIVSEYADEYPTKFRKIINDGSVHTFPKVGDVLSYDTGVFGHTAIVSAISVTDAVNGDATLTLIEQNADNSGSTTQLIDNWIIKGDVDDPTASGSDTVTGWLSPLTWIGDSPTTTGYSTAFNSVDASSPTNVWAAGYEVATGTTGRRPVTYQNTGSGWTRFAPTPAVNNQHSSLSGITAIDANNAWTVGTYHLGTSQTLAYKWNGSTWTRVTTVNPSGTTYPSELLAVDHDGSGNIFAVGYYNQGSNSYPLFQKSTGGNFATQSAQMPPTVVWVSLKDISFSSSVKGWAVGNANYGGTLKEIVYTYDGSSWTGSGGTIFRGSLKSVTAVSDTEAWAVGHQGSNNTPLIMHYTSANGWQEDTSFSFASGSSLNSVSAGATNDVWIIGGVNGVGPLVLHYNGSSWSQVSVPSTFARQDVTANSYQAWAVGFTGSGTSATPITNKH